MKCKEVLKYMEDYLNQALGADLEQEVQAHLDTCASCTKLAEDLKRTSLMVKSLPKLSAPLDFHEKVRCQIAARYKVPTSATTKTLAEQWFERIRTYLSGQVRVLRPALLGLILCITIICSILITSRDHKTSETELDWTYIKTCQEHHMSFASANPLADNSAILLMERTHSLKQ